MVNRVNKVRRLYQVPAKIDVIVRRSLPIVQERMEQAMMEGCPLDGYVIQRIVSLIRDEGDALEAMIGPACGWTTGIPVNVGGCYALRDPFCYLQRESQKHPQVTAKEDYPVYRRVVAILGGND